jgi:hypothetical protein
MGNSIMERMPTKPIMVVLYENIRKIKEKKNDV